MQYDCAIVGGGPAGLNAALVLGRARLRIALLDNNQPRNGVTHASHGFITRDGIEPTAFRQIGYEEVLRYPSVEHLQAEVISIHRTDQGFALHTSSDERLQARKILIAVGLKEVFPQIGGLRDFYGRSLFNCPFCDGWELRDQPLVVISEQPSVFHGAKVLYRWSRDIVVCTHGHAENLTAEQRQQLADKGIRVIDTPIASLTGQNGLLERVHFIDGTHVERSGGFVAPTFMPHARFEDALGYRVQENGGIHTDAMGKTTVPGVYAAGDSAYVMPSQLILAAASGSKAAMSVVADLTEEDWIRHQD
ncbi:NAD(P)/FAD-dependent oxidoreductase [Xylanibacillus composti]|uniref:FAD/NAD(P)-binding domain-containing protein n=1 Tax=Xylanibacillus composti TaxID=1572762 RepID=A0A8J4M394_9BACL|nr:NAD(P)/FAD-dependent oxidoreductase [Xylanibacillus composti]MDT9726315.1 NAD(P)/FAD-dependent oxidoreductase [Xylanibacillus composti]GIQ70579.1 hypothetical protein XYCOK13_34030 [Xylanibacillus composti]